MIYTHVLLIIWLLIGGFIGGFIQTIFAYAEDEAEYLSFNHAFWFVKKFYSMQEDKLNRAGLIIGMTSISVFILPGSILVILIVSFMKLITKLWDMFAYIFKKKP